MSRHAVDGDLVYSNGNVTVISARLIARTASDHVSVLCHSGTRTSESQNHARCHLTLQ